MRREVRASCETRACREVHRLSRLDCGASLRHDFCIDFAANFSRVIFCHTFQRSDVDAVDLVARGRVERASVDVRPRRGAVRRVLGAYRGHIGGMSSERDL